MTQPCAQEEIDKLIAAFFSAFDNRAGSEPRLSEILDCFSGRAVIARSVGSGTQICTPMEFATPRIELLTSGKLVDFHEDETSSTTQIFGNLAVRTSRYRKVGLLDGTAYAGAGSKCFQLVALDSDWRILSLAWIDDED